MPVLAKSEIEKRLRKGQIFKRDSWEQDRIRGAGYDLRIAPDYLIAPGGIRYWPGGPPERRTCREKIVLEPGEVAFVSSVERLCMPLNLAGNIAPKFDLARQGLLVMGGLLVDPGYGMELRGEKWEAAENGERLHFQLANIGDEELTLLPEKDKIAGIQFLELEGTVNGKGEKLKDISVPDSAELLETMFDRGDDEPLAPLAFFSRMRKLEGKVAALEAETKEQRTKLESTERSTEQLVVFGVFLVAITLFTVAVAALIEALSGNAIDDVVGTGGTAELTWTGFAIAAVLLAIVGAACWLMMRPVVEIVGGWRAKKKGSGGS